MCIQAFESFKETKIYLDSFPDPGSVVQHQGPVTEALGDSYADPHHLDLGNCPGSLIEHLGEVRSDIP
jgi:hypothetical protein